MPTTLIILVIIFLCGLSASAHASDPVAQSPLASFDTPLLPERNIGISQYTTDLEKELQVLQKPQNWSEKEWNQQLEKAQNEETRANIFVQLASLQQEQGLYQLAEDTYKQAAKENPNNPLIQLAIIKLYLAKRDTARVERTLNSAIKRFPEEETFDILRLKLLLQKQDFPSTSVTVQSALKKFPNNEIIHLISIVNAIAIKNKQLALANAIAGTRACPNSAMIHAIYAVTLMGNDLLEEAKIETEKALRLDNKCLAAQLVRVSIYDREGNTKAAANTMKQIIVVADYNRTFVIQYIRYLIKAGMESKATAPLLMVAASDIIDAERSANNKSPDATSLEQATIQKNIRSQDLKHGRIRQYLSLESQALRSDLLRMFSHLPASSIHYAFKQIDEYPGTDSSHTLARIIAGDVLWLLHRDKLATSCYESAATGKLPLRIAANSFSRFLLDHMNKPEAAVVWWQKASSYPSLSKQAQFNITILKRNIANRHNDIAGKIKGRQQTLLRMLEFGSTDELLNPDSGPMRYLKRECVDESIK